METLLQFLLQCFLSHSLVTFIDLFAYIYLMRCPKNNGKELYLLSFSLKFVRVSLAQHNGSLSLIALLTEYLSSLCIEESGSLNEGISLWGKTISVVRQRRYIYRQINVTSGNHIPPHFCHPWTRNIEALLEKIVSYTRENHLISGLTWWSCDLDGEAAKWV